MNNQFVDLDRKQALKDLYRPNRFKIDDRFILRDGKKHPLAVICPGGGYATVCSFIEGVPFARRLNAMGISAAIVYYRVRKKAAFPNPQDDLAQAIRLLLEKAEQYNLDTDGYSVWGSSAGGHLAATFGTEHLGYPHYHLPKPGAMVLVYPVITMDPALTHMGTHDNLLGKDATQQLENIWSVEKNVTSLYPPTYIWCGDADKTVPPENTRQMADALEQAGVPFRQEIFSDIDHGVGLGTGSAAEGWFDRAVAFWLEHR